MNRHQRQNGLTGDMRYRIGMLLFALAGLSILIGVLSVLTGFVRNEPGAWPVWILAGPPEILCVLAAAILGNEKYQKLATQLRRSRPLVELKRASKFRYYAGLAGCLFNGVPLILYAYAPEMMPGGTTKLGILVLADAVFLFSLFFAGGEFWEKLRSIFVWEPHS